MGAEITAVDRKLDREIDSNAGGTGGKAGGGTNPTNTTAGGTGGTGTGGTGTGGTTAGGKTEKGQELSGLALLTPEEQAAYTAADDKEKRRLLRNAKRRAKYAEQKKASGADVKPRKVNRTKTQTTDTPQPIDTKQLNLIIAGVSGAIASRPNCEHWLLTEQEINSITVPLSKMLAESDLFSGMGQYSNQIALVMACVTVFVPRMVITIQKNKEVKRNAVTGQSTKTNVTDRRIADTGKAQNGNTKPNNRNVAQPASNGTNDVPELPWYGNPIY